MSKRSLLSVGLLVFMMTSARDAPAQGCRADTGIHEAIVNMWGPYFENPNDAFVDDARAPDLGGLRQRGFEVVLQGDPKRDDELVSYVYSVKKDRPAWKLYISTVVKNLVNSPEVEKFAVLQLHLGEQRYSAPLAGPAREPSREIIRWLQSNRYRVFDSATLRCPTSYRRLQKGQKEIPLRKSNIIRYWQMLFRISPQIP